MKRLMELSEMFNDTELDKSFNKDQIDMFYSRFKDDFMLEEFEFKGVKIKIAPQNSKIEEFSDYNETFVHIVTRKTSRGRVYDSARANRSHWVKTILENHESKLIQYYKWKDEKGVCKEHFWFRRKDFMVVLKPVSTNLMIVTAFCVDDDEKLKFFERFKDYEEGNSNC